MLSDLIRGNTQLKMMLFAQTVHVVNLNMHIALQQDILDKAMEAIDKLQEVLKVLAFEAVDNSEQDILHAEMAT